jgi:flagellar protein FlaG
MDIQSIGRNSPSGSLITEKLSPPNSSTVANAQNSTGVQTTAAVTQAAKSPSASEVSKAVSEINKTLQATSQNLEFSVDTDADEVVVKVIDQQTKEVIRQIPTVEALEIAKSLDKLQGLLIKQEA